ncbi:YrhK family protein [Pseudokineococcus marinus]|nr:YrhK family protein [Pseudokineococcus marinus]
MPGSGEDLRVRIGDDELVLRQRYEVLSITNDVLVALWFVIGSVLFFWESTSTAGTWFFLVGSLQFLARPAIRLSRKIHLQRRHGSGLDSGGEY